MPDAVLKSSVMPRLLVLRCRKIPEASGIGLVVAKRAVGAGGVAGAGAFDLQHVRPVVREELRAIGPGDMPGEVQDFEAREWLHGAIRGA